MTPPRRPIATVDGGRRLGAGALRTLLVLLAFAPVARAVEPIHVRGMTFLAGESDGRQLVVRAERAEIDPRAEMARLHAVTVTLRGAEVGGEITLACETARVALAGDAFRLEGDVRAQDARGRRFETAWLEFDGATRILRTTAPVVVMDRGAEYRGESLEYHVEQRWLRLSGGARVERGAP